MGLDGKYRALVALAALWPGPAAACRLALLLALDISSSVDAEEDALQRQGLARALMAPEVAEAVLAVPDDPVALAVYEWSGRYQQQTILDWTLIPSLAELSAVSSAISASRRSYAEYPTALGYALGHAATIFARAPDCLQAKLDVSGDGINNDGFPPALAYANFPLDGVTVNGLAIGGHDPEVLAYYRSDLIRGPGAFAIEADGFADFERAMREKLVREMGVRLLGAK